MYRQESEEPIGLARHGTRELTEFEQDRFRPQVIAPPTEDNALRRLLGQDLDKFIEEHLGAYNEAKKKWAECSMEEWQAGAEGKLTATSTSG